MTRLVIGLLVCAASCVAQTSAAKPDVMYCGAQVAPAKIVSFEPNAGSMALKNVRKLPITAYRIDRFLVRRNKVQQVATGRLVLLPAALMPGETKGLLAPGDNLIAPLPDRVVFFIAELTFSDGSHWSSEYLRRKGAGCLEG